MILPASEAVQLPWLGSPYTVLNAGDNTVYYGTQAVSATNNVGSVAPGATQQFTVQYYVISPFGATEIEFHADTSPVAGGVASIDSPDSSVTVTVSAGTSHLQVASAIQAAASTAMTVHLAAPDPHGDRAAAVAAIAASAVTVSGVAAVATATVSDMAALNAIGHADMQASSAQHVKEYNTAVQVTETFANLAAWTKTSSDVNATPYQVSAGKAFSAIANQSTKPFSQAFANLITDHGFVECTFVVPAAAGAANANVGLFVSTIAVGNAAFAANPLLNSVGIAIEVNGGAILFNPGVGVVAQHAEGNPPGANITSGTYNGNSAIVIGALQTITARITWDENTFCCMLIGANHAWEARYYCARSVIGALASVAFEIVDARDLTGAAVGPINSRPASFAVTTTGTVPDDLVVHTSSLSQYGGGGESHARVWMPKARDSRLPVPLVLFNHGGYMYLVAGSNAAAGYSATPAAGTALAGSPFDYLNATLALGNANTLQNLVNNGFAVASSAQEGPTTMGVAQPQADMLALYRYCRSRFNVGPVILAGVSMGGVGAANLLAARTIPNVVGLLLFSPLLAVTRQINVLINEFVTLALANDAYYAAYTWGAQTAAFFAQLYVTPYGKTLYSDPTLLTAAAPFDPSQIAAGRLRGVGMLAYAAAADTALPANLADTQNFFNAHSAYAREATVISTSGDHASAPVFADQSGILSFCQRCVAA